MWLALCVGRCQMHGRCIENIRITRFLQPACELHDRPTGKICAAQRVSGIVATCLDQVGYVIFVFLCHGKLIADENVFGFYAGLEDSRKAAIVRHDHAMIRNRPPMGVIMPSRVT